MIIIHSTQSHIDTLPSDLRDSMITYNHAIASNSIGVVEIYFTDQQWLDLITAYGADQYFDDEDQGGPWIQVQDDQQENMLS
jgi:hypothetical protein